MSERLERMKNELMLSKMQKKRRGRHIPLIASVGTILTSIILISWTLYIF